jgi:hypothetical protein
MKLKESKVAALLISIGVFILLFLVTITYLDDWLVIPVLFLTLFFGHWVAKRITGISIMNTFFE